MFLPRRVLSFTETWHYVKLKHAIGQLPKPVAQKATQLLTYAYYLCPLQEPGVVVDRPSSSLTACWFGDEHLLVMVVTKSKHQESNTDIIAVYTNLQTGEVWKEEGFSIGESIQTTRFPQKVENILLDLHRYFATTEPKEMGTMWDGDPLLEANLSGKQGDRNPTKESWTQKLQPLMEVLQAFGMWWIINELPQLLQRGWRWRFGKPRIPFKRRLHA